MRPARATSLAAVTTHALLPGESLAKLQATGLFTAIVATDSHPRAHDLQPQGLEVVSIPTNRAMVRDDNPDLIYKSEAAKFEALADDISERYAEGQPVLVGTISVEKSEHLARLLEKRGIPHAVLNAKQHEREAHVVTQAGRPKPSGLRANSAPIRS